MQRFESVQGWIFQLEGVLYDGTAWRRWLLQLLSKRGLHTHYHLFFRHWDLEYVPQIHSGALSFQEAVEKMLAHVGMTAGHIHEIFSALRSKRKVLTTEERPLPGVAELLKSLKSAGHTLALWSLDNCDQEAIEEKTARLGLAPYFDFVAQAKKRSHGHVPDRLLASTLSSIKVARDHVAFVGQGRETLRMAHMIGLRTVAIGSADGAVADRKLDAVIELQQMFSPRLRQAG